MRNSTIIVKKKKCVSCGNLDYVFSKGRCKQCATIQDTQRRISEHEQNEDAESWQNVLDDLDAVYSQWVRISAADSNGVCACYTCGAKYNYKEMDCGHFLKRSLLSTRFLPANTKPQCKTCNQYKDGNEIAFEKHLRADGVNVEELRQIGREVVHPTLSELKELLVAYRHKLSIVRTKLIKK